MKDFEKAKEELLDTLLVSGKRTREDDIRFANQLRNLERQEQLRRDNEAQDRFVRITTGATEVSNEGILMEFTGLIEKLKRKLGL